jgi:hypothetical protein
MNRQDYPELLAYLSERSKLADSKVFYVVTEIAEDNFSAPTHYSMSRHFSDILARQESAMPKEMVASTEQEKARLIDSVFRTKMEEDYVSFVRAAAAERKVLETASALADGKKDDLPFGEETCEMLHAISGMDAELAGIKTYCVAVFQDKEKSGHARLMIDVFQDAVNQLCKDARYQEGKFPQHEGGKSLLQDDISIARQRLSNLRKFYGGTARCAPNFYTLARGSEMSAAFDKEWESIVESVTKAELFSVYNGAVDSYLEAHRSDGK